MDIGIEHRVLDLFNAVYFRLSDVFFELKLNIKTQCFFDKVHYDKAHSDSIGYVGARYIQLISAFNILSINYSQSTLLDIGCGKGRAVAVAATHSFRKIIGVEYDKKLVLLAQKNILKMRCKALDKVEIHCQDATSYDISPDINVIYMFNPFTGDTLKKVVENIHESYKSKPRKIHIIYLNHDDFDLAIKGQTWLTKVLTLPSVDGVNGSVYATSDESITPKTLKKHTPTLNDS